MNVSFRRREHLKVALKSLFVAFLHSLFLLYSIDCATLLFLCVCVASFIEGVICYIYALSHHQKTWKTTVKNTWNDNFFSFFFFSNILYCSDPGCSAIQFTHNSKQQHGCHQKGMEIQPDGPEMDLRLSVCPAHSHRLPWGVLGPWGPRRKCRTWGLWPTEENERNLLNGEMRLRNGSV